MKVRYTEPAANELEAIVSYFRDIAPSVVADSIDDAISQLLDNPYLVQETEKPGVRRWYIRRFRYSIFSPSKGMTSSSSISSMPRAAGRGRSKKVEERVYVA